MKVTRVVFTDVNLDYLRCDCKAICSVVLDDCIMLTSIALCSNKNNGNHFLLFPSKQDVYKDIQNLNKGISINYPENKKKQYSNDISKMYEEFYHPVRKGFYDELLSVILEGYKCCVCDNKIIDSCYHP